MCSLAHFKFAASRLDDVGQREKTLKTRGSGEDGDGDGESDGDMDDGRKEGEF